MGCSAVILAEKYSQSPSFDGLEEATDNVKSDVKLFGKPTSRPFRRMGVALAYDELNGDLDNVIKKAKAIAGTVKVN